MHEMSIVEALLEAVGREAQAYPAMRVQTVRVRIGSLRLVVPETLKFCYAAATGETALAGSVIEIEEVPARARCPGCSAEFPVKENWFQCPTCAALDGELLSGNELDLTSIELAEVCVA
jgi:hydrogenase nickel incorporation protein HypA/HybF